MNKIRQSPKRPAGERRGQLLKAAHDLLLKKGYRDTSMDDIARRARLTKGALYFHFKNKEDILVELVKQAMAVYDERIRQMKGKPISPAKLFELFVKEHSLHFGNNYIFTVDFWIRSLTVPSLKNYFVKNHSQMIENLADLIKPEYGSKKKRREMVIMIMALSDGLILQQWTVPDAVSLNSQRKLFGELWKNFESGRGKKKP